MSLQHELKEVEEKFRKAMILNAQLDNDKAALGYQLELLKDRIEELQEEHAQLQVCHYQFLGWQSGIRLLGIVLILACFDS
jgi:predicted nuclease with TOPRIM domain